MPHRGIRVDRCHKRHGPRLALAVPHAGEKPGERHAPDAPKGHLPSPQAQLPHLPGAAAVPLAVVATSSITPSPVATSAAAQRRTVPEKASPGNFRLFSIPVPVTIGLEEVEEWKYTRRCVRSQGYGGRGHFGGRGSLPRPRSVTDASGLQER